MYDREALRRVMAVGPERAVFPADGVEPDGEVEPANA
jgi:hypothetical protein